MAELTDIKGIGAARKRILFENGIYSLDDLMSFFPYRFIDLDDITEPCDAPDGEYAVFKGRVTAEAVTRRIRRGFSYTRVGLESAKGGAFSVVFFNRPYIKNQLPPGGEFVFFGKVSRRGRSTGMANPLFEKSGGAGAQDAGTTSGGGLEKPEGSGICTVYPPIRGIPKRVLKETIQKNMPDFSPEGVIPDDLRERFGIFPPAVAYKKIHAPDSMSDVEKYSRSVAAEELVQLILAFKLLKEKQPERTDFFYADTEKAAALESRLPFSLTAGQKAVFSEILQDLSGKKVMNRLLQGDVGSGKTAVAFLAMCFCALSGAQAALMAPTEVLARQHFQKFTAMFPDVPAVLLTGGLPEKTQKDARFAIRTGAADAVFGTHSLLSDSVAYKDLRMIITDEQHRFGVSQRSALESKSRTADTLALSATPIPRSLALVMYGDLDVSILRGAPAGRKPILTRIVPPEKTGGMLDYILAESKKDNRAYIVMPQVDDDGGEDGDGEGRERNASGTNSGTRLTSAKKMYESLTMGRFKSAPVGLIYGGMRPEEKQRAFRDFSEGKTKILVATTVVEVGVDVPEANVMAVFSADRFGLSQLHQLRGRVGRGDKESYCFLLPGAEGYGGTASERLELMTKTSDGFELSEYDLKTRGAGDFIGLRQHGVSGLSNLRIGLEEITIAREIANEMEKRGIAGYFMKLKRKYRELVSNVVLN